MRETGEIAGFEWDKGNRQKCRKHGMSIREVESMFDEDRTVLILPDKAHSQTERRLLAIGLTHTRTSRVRGVHDAKDRRQDLHPADQRPLHAQEGDCAL